MILLAPTMQRWQTSPASRVRVLHPANRATRPPRALGEGQSTAARLHSGHVAARSAQPYGAGSDLAVAWSCHGRGTGLAWLDALARDLERPPGDADCGSGQRLAGPHRRRMVDRLADHRREAGSRGW